MTDQARMDVKADEVYRLDFGYTAKREYGETPNGVPMNGRWVLRDMAGQMVDFDLYRYDLFERHGLKPKP